MAAYAALVSVMHIIDQLQHHPRPPISLDKKQVDSLSKKVAFLQEFLEVYNPHVDFSTEADPLESRIADAAYAAEDVIESHIVDQITNHGENISSDGLYQGLEKVIEAMASVEKTAMEIKESMRVQVQHQLQRNSTPLDSLRSSSMVQNSSMVGVADVLHDMKDKLTGGRRDLQVIPIVGMGGTGKTTLARNIYREPLIKEHFHICAWATISQEYSITEIFTEFLGQLNEEVGQNLSEDLLGEMLYKHLSCRKYLITMDDMWSIDAWDRVGRFLPDNKNGSRIVITTRLSNLASKLTSSNSLEMKLLDEANSWDLLSKTVFGEKGCPIELEEIGKKIGKSCKGLPLSIVVVGGLLAKSKHTIEFWDYIEENLNSIVNLEDNKRCLKILHLSYKQLPVYLKPCFLYMGVFPEDDVISVSTLTKLWVAEGFLKPINGKCLEEIAKEYLKDLTDRNLISIHKKGSTGNIKYCKIHDLLRDLCLGEAQKQRFYAAQGVTNTQRRVVISSTSNKEAIDGLQSVSLARSLIWGVKERPPSLNLRLLRIFQSTKYSFPYLENMLQLVNLRYVADMFLREEKLLSSLHQLWNLETLIVKGVLHSKFTLPAEIWYMPQIRHVEFEEVYLPDPPSVGDDDDIVLGNLQTLVEIINFKCSEEVVKRVPNIKKLGINYREVEGSLSSLKNLVYLHKLESLDCFFFPKINPSGPESLSFPHSLKKLKLRIDYSQCWQDILENIATLPFLEKLKLYNGCFEKGKWETVEGQFRSLKYLKIFNCDALKQWTTESSHFPRLEHLVLDGLHGLTEIPLDVAEIATLRLINLKYCSASVFISAKRIVEEQEELHGEVAIQVRVMLREKNIEALESLASPNIQVEFKE